MNTYWKCSPGVADKIRDALQLHLDYLKKCRAIKKRVNADGVLESRGFATHRLEGFTFAEPPDNRVWVSCRGNGPIGFRPRRNRENKSLNEQFGQCVSTFDADVLDVLGLPLFIEGMRYRHAGVRVVNDDVFVVLDEADRPKSCSRISDLEFVEATKKKRRK